MPGLQMTKSRSWKALAQSVIPWLQIPRCHYLFIEVVMERLMLCLLSLSNAWKQLVSKKRCSQIVLQSVNIYCQ